MTTSTWQAATPGQPTRSGFVNQFLAMHTSSLYYGSNKMPGVSDPTAVAAGTTYVGNGSLAQQFTVTSTITSQYVMAYLGLAARYSGCDLLVQLCQANGSNPDTSTVLAKGVVPAEWLATSNPPAVSTTTPSASFVPVPLYPAVTLQTTTPGPSYFIVVSVLSNGIPTINDAYWATATAGMSGTHLQLTAGSWASVGTNPFAMFLRYGTTTTNNTLKAVVEDGGTLVKAYSRNTSTGQLTGAYEYAQAQANPNVLCRDDSIFGSSSSTGTWGATGASLSILSNSLVAAATSSSVVLTVGAYPTTSYAATAGTQYTFVAQVKAASTGRSITPALAFYNSSGTLIGSTYPGSAVSDVSTGWSTVSATATAPATTAYVRGVLSYASTSTEVHYVDNVMIAPGPSTVFAPPGYGVASARALTYTSTTSTTITSIS